MVERPYLDFYSTHGANLVSREIADRGRFFMAREQLYVALGIAPHLLEGKSILEFGPGTGHNALYTDSLSPKRFVLVDGDEAILDASRDRLEAQGLPLVQREYVHALFEEFKTEEKFDLVIAEACIPNQPAPAETLRRMLTFVKPGGTMVFTTVSAASWLSEITRRIAKFRCRTPDGAVDVEVLSHKLAPHFAELQEMARTPKEWILDNLLQPLSRGELFSIPNAINVLTEEYLVSGSSPSFAQDWRWYKDVSTSRSTKHAEIIDQYHKHIAHFLDRRVTGSTGTAGYGERVESHCLEIWKGVISIEKTQSEETGALEDLLSDLSSLARLVVDISPVTARSLEEAVDWIGGGLERQELEFFPNWWGRAQQHIGVIKSRYSLR